MNKIEKLALEITRVLDKHNSSSDTAIYFNNKRLATFTDGSYGKWVLQEGYKGSDYTDYANNETITMTFEGMGSLYDAINYFNSETQTLLLELDELFESYGYYYEMGNSWNLALFEI